MFLRKLCPLWLGRYWFSTATFFSCYFCQDGGSKMLRWP